MQSSKNNKETKTMKETSQSNTKQSEPSITDKIAKLNADIEWFYGDDFSLDQAAKKYQNATNLAQEILKDLEQLKNTINLIDQDFS